ncbi:YhcH/YjgK/YiaL family protein [Hydrogenovibrio kuenenii]|uniref:YhcH/YjgK/YiaL family protein n=1 Tax=Hydrogenovibrio kuenenii TaxID=63658 RepID=UPI000467E733|nr:YhcH/YjgK/YiaL family protein [Hydrogenovibrio kuenenii]
MAVIGNYFQVKEFFKTNNKLNQVFAYLDDALDPTSEVHQRIFSSKEPRVQKNDIDGECFAMEQVYMTKERESCFFESHKKYVDFQLILSGCEQMEVIDIRHLSFKNFEEDKDFISYEDSTKASKIVMQHEDLSVYFPNDAHLGLAFFETKQLVYKTVVKVPVEYFR